MRLNDIVKGLVLGTALYAAGCGGKEKVYPCRTSADCASGRCVEGYCEESSGGGEGFCDEYMNMCSEYLHDSLEEHLRRCNSGCDDLAPPTPQYQPNRDCARIACGVELGICSKEASAISPRQEEMIVDCILAYGWSRNADK